jgi:hypothetical protein
MDFSNTAFRPPLPTTKVSEDTMSHANLVMSCQWGWTSTQDSTGTGARATLQASSATEPASTSPFHNVRAKRFAPCQGRLYHQLTCSHRIRTDMVEDCGANCVEPLGQAAGVAFICHECLQAEATQIWEDRKAQHNAGYPQMELMTPELYEQWYQEHRQLEAEFARDHRAYEQELKSKTRPSNTCSAAEASTEDMNFAAELDSLSLSMMASTDAHLRQPDRPRTNLPSDPSEQLHWNLDTLALDRGSCGFEYTSSASAGSVPAMRRTTEEGLWGKRRG